jgi:predicted MFS family arabinose efflux permease
MSTSQPVAQHLLNRSLAVLALTAGVSISNIYYNQPLLTEIGESFPDDASWVGAVAASTQLGFAVGMVLISPLGDKMDRRRLILYQAAGICVALLSVALAPTLTMLAVASFVLGLFATMAQQAGPFAAELTPPAERGRAIGLVMSGLLLGILLARTFSGFIGSHFGWRAVFAMAIAPILLMAVMVWRILPSSQPTATLSYRRLISSPWRLAVELPDLREAALTGAALFAAFSLFWTTLVLLLNEPPLSLGAQEAGLFALLGVVGILAAPWAGRMTDRHGPRPVIWLAITLMATSFVILLLGAASIAGLVAGVIVLDASLQIMQTANQSRVFALRPEAKSRLNTAYMVCYFFGGALGSGAGYLAWQWLRWPAVCMVGLVFVLVAAISHGRSSA